MDNTVIQLNPIFPIQESCWQQRDAGSPVSVKGGQVHGD